MKAKKLNSIAILQEYLQMEYTKYSDEYDKYETQLDLLKAKHPDYFFQSSNGYVLDSEEHVMYLINKSGLPEEIKKQVVGGEAITIGDFYNQRDVYGITSDLLVYYCENGISTILGLTGDDLEKDNPLEETYTADSKLAKFINGGTKSLTNQDLKKITNLEINKSDDIELLKDFKNLPNLNKVEFKNISVIESLDGIGGATNLTEVRFENCSVNNYSELVKNKNLNKLYLILPAGKDKDVENLCSKEVGIGNEDLPNLQYLAITGFPSTIQSLRQHEMLEEYSYSKKTRYEIKTVDSLSNLTEITKKSVNYLYINNLQIHRLENALKGFSNVNVLRCEYNDLLNFKGLENLVNLNYLFANKQEVKSFGIEDSLNGNDNVKDALASLQNLTSLKHIDLTDNSIFKWCKYLKKLNKLEYLNLSGCNGILDFSEIVNIVNMLGQNAKYPGQFGNDVIAKSSKILNLSSSTITKSVFEKLKNNADLYALNLRKTKITDEDGRDLDLSTYNNMINDVLGSCSGMQYLEISYQTLLNDISFVKNMKNLRELNLIDDFALIDLSTLEEMSLAKELKLNTLMLSNPEIDLTKIQSAISDLCDDIWTNDFDIVVDEGEVRNRSFWYSDLAITDEDHIFGLILTNVTLMKKLESCSKLTNLVTRPGWRAKIPYNFTGTLDLSGLIHLRSLYYGSQRFDLTLPENLEIFHYNLTTALTVNFSKCKKLKAIRTFCVNVKDSYKILFSTFSEEFNSLEYLWLQDQRTQLNGVSYCDNLDWLEKFKNCKNFKDLVIQQNNTWTTYNWESLEGLKFIKNLEHLELNFTINDGGCLSDFPDLSGLTNLKFLQIKYGNMNLDNIKTCKNLEELVINNTFIQNVNFLSEINGLKKIDLSNNRINDIYGLLRKTLLSELKLGYNDLIDISPLSDLSALQHLELNNNKLSDFGYDNTGKSYYTQSVLTDLNQKYNLKNLYLWGNLYDDYSIITSDDLKWDSLILDEKDKPEEET